MNKYREKKLYVKEKEIKWKKEKCIEEGGKDRERQKRKEKINRKKERFSK